MIDTRVTKARVHLLLDHPFWGTLALRLQLVENSTSCETLQTDGTVLEYNPDYVASLTDDELMGVVAHEVGHCALLHPYRGKELDPLLSNMAADYALNPLLLDSGLTLPKDVLNDSRFHGMPMEQIYAILESEQSKPKPEGDGGAPGKPGDQPQPPSGGGGGTPPPNGNGKPQPGGGGKPDPNGAARHFRPSPEPAPPGTEPAPGDPVQTESMTALDWQIVAETAASVSRKAGGMTGDIARALAEARQTTVDWKTILRRFVEHTVPSDYSWMAPNRRYVAAGLYLPGTIRENTPRLAIAIDTSSSINSDLLNAFASEMTAIMHEVRPVAIDVVYCDTKVKGEQTFVPDDGEIKLEPVGGGGTHFQPVLDWVEARDEPPAALIYFTDLICGDKLVEPEYPVLWITPSTSRREGPFGETVRIPPASLL